MPRHRAYKSAVTKFLPVASPSGTHFLHVGFSDGTRFCCGGSIVGERGGRECLVAVVDATVTTVVVAVVVGSVRLDGLALAGRGARVERRLDSCG